MDNQFLDHYLEVQLEENNMRCDRFIRTRLSVPQSMIAKLFRTGNVLIDGKLNKEINTRLITGNIVTIITPRLDNPHKEKIKTSFPIPLGITKDIIKAVEYENDDFVIINKPYNLATQSGGSLKYSLDDIARKLWGDEIRIVHRLDKETSGLIVLAKNRPTAQKLSLWFKNSLIEKEYLAVVNPIPKKSKGTVKTYIAKQRGLDVMNKYYNSSPDEYDAKEAITDYEVIQKDILNSLALISFKPLTGRTHQIRLHSSYLGCPILGDFRYNASQDEGRQLQLLSYRISFPRLDIDEEQYLALLAAKNYTEDNNKNDKLKELYTNAFTISNFPEFFSLKIA